MRIALGIEYRGGAYCGWQSQPSGCGVQDYVETALTRFAGEGAPRIAVTCAGRTDTGVHALSQVVHFDTMLQRDPASWTRGVNTFLPPDVRVLWAKPVDDEFHARFSARSRSYRYLLLNHGVDVGVLRGMAGWFHLPLEVERMRAAAARLPGEHDFSAFRAAECQAKSPVKTLWEATVERRGDLVVFGFRANAFLHHMVRNIVGELVYVGAGRRSVADFERVFAGRDRAAAAPTFAPDGLYLAAIEYDERFALPPPRDAFPFAF